VSDKQIKLNGLEFHATTNLKELKLLFTNGVSSEQMPQDIDHRSESLQSFQIDSRANIGSV